MIEAWGMADLNNRDDLLNLMASTLDERVVPILLKALGSADEKVAAMAKAGLAHIREVAEQRQFWEEWEATGSGVSPTVALIRKAREGSEKVRVAAIRSLGTMGAPEALPFLVEMLEDDNDKIAAAAAAALEKINGEE